MKVKQLLMVVLSLMVCSVAGHASGPQLTNVSVVTQGNGVTVTLYASGAFTHNEYRPADGLLLVDLVGVSAAELKQRSRALDGPAVKSYEVVGYTGANGVPIARVQLTLTARAEVRINPSREGLAIAVLPPAGAAAAPQGAGVQPATTKRLTTASVPSAPESPGVTSTKKPAPATATPAGPVEVQNIKVSAGNQGGFTTVEISANGPLTPRTMKLTGPDRIVLDLLDAVPVIQPRTVAVNAGGVIAVRLGRFQERPPITRLVVDLSATCEFDLSNQGNKVSLRVRPRLSPRAKCRLVPPSPPLQSPNRGRK